MTRAKAQKKTGDGRLGPYYEISLGLIGDGLDVTLSTVLEAIGEAIAASHTRIEMFAQRYGEDAADELAEEEIPVIEDFLGAAFVVCQTYIGNVVAGLKRLHAHVQRQNNVSLRTASGSGADLRAYGFRPTERRPFSPIEVLHAYANYYKHGDEWGADWENAKGETSRVISATGASPHSSGNLRLGAKYLGNRKFSDVAVFTKIFSKGYAKGQKFRAVAARLSAVDCPGFCPR